MPPVVILGLGVSGLGCALELARSNIPFIAIEKEDRAGGLARTDTAGGFCFDHGPHILLGVPAELETLFRELKELDLAISSGRSGIVLGTQLKRVFDAPFQHHLNQLSLSRRARLLPGLIRDRLRRKVPANYADYAIQHCGRGVYDLFLRGYETKRLRFPLDQLPANWSNRLNKTSLLSLILSYNPVPNRGYAESRFLYPRDGGMEALPKAMLRLVPQPCIRYRVQAVALNVKERIVTLDNGERVRYTHLVSSLPLRETVALISDVPPSIRRATGNLLFTSVYVLNAGIQGPVPSWSVLRFPHTNLGFYRLSFPSTYAPGCTPAGFSTVVGEISHHPTRHPLSPEDAKEQFHAGLERLGILQPGEKPAFESVRNIPYAHLVYNQETNASITLILEYLKEHAVTMCGKYGLWRDMLIPQSIITGITAARDIVATTRA